MKHFVCKDVEVLLNYYKIYYVKNGNDLMLEMELLASEKTLKETYKEDPIGIGYGVWAKKCNA